MNPVRLFALATHLECLSQDDDPLKEALNKSILDSSERAAVKMRFSPCFKIND